MKIITRFKSALITLFSGLFLAGAIYIVSCSPQKKPVESNNEKKPVNYELLAHEKPGRGLIATPIETGKKVYWGEGSFSAETGKVFIAWRLLAKDPGSISFNVYRQVENEQSVKLNESPIKNSTNFIDGDAPFGKKISYFIKTVINDKEEETTAPYMVGPLKTDQVSYKSIKLKGDYTFAKVAIADLDGDGECDFVIKYPGGNVDPWYLYWRPSPGTFTLEAYKSNGEYLWTYDMGWAIEQGSWYSPYVVYDLDGDGAAEVIVKSGLSDPDPRNEEGKVESGPEYVSILDGKTGTPRARADWIPREPFYEANKQHAYNYASRNQIGIAYLDGIHPHVIVARGTYNLMIVRAYRLVDNDLKLVWEWDNRNAPKKYWAQGGHWMVCADVDGDGCDEVVLGSCVLSNNGKELWSTGLGHCDASYLGDLDPDRPGLEIYYNIERTCPDGNGMCMADAKTGEIIWGTKFPTHHIHGVGLCSDIDRVHPGRVCYGVEIANFEGKRNDFAVMHNCKGEIISQDFLDATYSVYWDTDNQRELLGRGKIFDFRGGTVHNENIEGTVIAVADITGDWREEIITSVSGELRIYSSTILARTRHVCLMQDPIYRNNVAHASMGYYQVPLTTYSIPFGSSR